MIVAVTALLFSIIMNDTVDAVDAVANSSYAARIRALLDSDDEDEDDAVDEEKRDDEGIPNKTETAFLLNGNSIKLLCVMCIGVKDDNGAALFDVNNEKYRKSSLSGVIYPPRWIGVRRLLLWGNFHVQRIGPTPSLLVGLRLTPSQVNMMSPS